jgi:hypothetical protein
LLSACLYIGFAPVRWQGVATKIEDMVYRKWSLPDNYRPLLAAILLLMLGITASAQVYQRMPNRYNIREAVFDSSMGIPYGATPDLRSSIQQSNPGRLFFNTGDSSLYAWTGTQWLVVGGGAAVEWGTITGDIEDQADLMALLNARVLYSDTANMLTNYLRSNRFDSLVTVVGNIETTQSSLTFTNGLLKTGDEVIALYNDAIWNSGKIQGYNVAATAPTDGQVLVWDAADNRYEPGSAAGGATPTLQQVTTAGNTTTDNLTTGLISWQYGGTTIGNLTTVISGSDYGGSLRLKDYSSTYFSQLYTQNSLTDHLSFYLPKTGNLTDTLATLHDVRAAGGGGGGSPPTLQDVLTEGATYSGTANISYTTTGSYDITKGDPAGQYAYLSFSSNNSAYLGTSHAVNGDYSSINVFNSTTSGQGGLVDLVTGSSTVDHQLKIFENYMEFRSNAGSGTLYIRLLNLPVYADEAAAAAAFLTTNTIYKTSTGELRIKL